MVQVFAMQPTFSTSLMQELRSCFL